MTVPENIQQLAVGYYRRVVDNFNRLAVITEAVIGGIIFGTPRITDTGTDDTLKTPEPGVGTPESAQSEGCRLGQGRLVQI